MAASAPHVGTTNTTTNATSSHAKDTPNQTSTTNTVATTSSPASANTSASSPSPAEDMLSAFSVAVPSEGARDNVSVKKTAQKAPKKQKGPPKTRKPVIGPKKRVWVEMKALKYCIQVHNPGYAAIEVNPSGKFRSMESVCVFM